MGAEFLFKSSAERLSAPARRELPLVVHDALSSPGQRLDASTRSVMESRFDYDFSGVRVHADSRAAQSAQAVGALSYTVGRDVFFDAGQYSPHTSRGRGLLAHELAHVVQQGESAPSSTDGLTVAEPDSAEERLADVSARAAARGEPQPAAARFGRRVMRATRTFSLTFDDGPHVAELGKGINRTEHVLDVLKNQGIKAGFFIQTGVSFRGANKIGKALVARMNAEGHTIGIHTGGTADHEDHTAAQKAGRLESELGAAKKYVQEQTGKAATLVRPPHGTSDEAVLATYKKMGLTNVLWDMDGDQGKDLGLDALKGRVSSEMLNVQKRGWKPTTPSPNVVVLYHDIQKGTSENIGALIDHIKATTKDISEKKDSATFAAP